MDDPNPSSTLAPLMADTSATVDLTSMEGGDQLKNIDDQKRIAQMEHEIFTVCKQLDEKSKKCKETQEQNAMLKDRLGTLEQEKLERGQFVEQIVRSRDMLIAEKADLQNDRLSLEKRRDELEFQVSKLTNEKRRHLDDIDHLRKKCEDLLNERTDLQGQIDDFRGEKALIAYDKEQWSREKEILLKSKQWYMNEITEREQKINELRIELIKQKSDSQREISLLSDQNNELTLQVEQLTENLSERESELSSLREQFKQNLNEQSNHVNELEAELRARERLANVYKSNAEAANKEIAELHENEQRLQDLLQSSENAANNLKADIARILAEHKTLVEEKNAEIKRLGEEVTKSTELFNAGFRLNRPDEELARLSPAAAAASSLLKSGMSLTGIYAEHCRVVSELDKKNAEFNQLERYVTELIEDLDSKAPKFQEQRKAYEQVCERNECLRLQNELLGKERQKLQQNCDSFLRELTFTKRELERYQREHQILTKQVNRLVYVIEKGAEALDHGSMNGDGAQDQYLFSNIREMHAKNIELAEELERLHESQDKIIENYHSAEINILKQTLQQSQEDLRLLRDNYSKQELLVNELTEQRNQFKQLSEQSPATALVSSNASIASEENGPATQFSQNRRESLDAVHSELNVWKMRAERLQDTLTFLNEDRQSHEKTLNDRIDQQLEQISLMRTTIGKLEGELEFQNKNQQLLSRQIDSYALDLKRSNESLSDAKRQLETLQFKHDGLTTQLLDKQQDLSTLKVQNHSLGEQLSIVQSREQRLQAEMEILRTARYNSERVALTLQEVETVLKRVEVEKTHASESQLQSALLERDNLRQLVDNLHDQHSQLVTGLKANLNQASADRDKAQAEFKSLQNNMSALDNVYQRLKGDHEKLRQEMEQIQSTDTNVEACKKEIQKLKNTVAYQEKQIADWEQKCNDMGQTIEAKDKQMERLCNLGSGLEDSIQWATMERQRMQAVREQLETDLAAAKTTVEELRNQLAAKEMEVLEHAKNLSEVCNQMEGQRSEHEQERMVSAKELHEAQMQLNHLRTEEAKLKEELQASVSLCNELSDEKVRLSCELAREMGQNEELKQKIVELTGEFNGENEKLRHSLDLLEQEKLRLNDEVSAYMKREEENVQKQNLLYDEIQKQLTQISHMERLQQTLASPNASLNTSFNVGTPNTSRFSTDSTQQQSDRLSTIIGYMRSEKQKETELRMNAELEMQRIRTQTAMDQQRISQLESQLSKLQTEAEANAKAAQEKDALLVQLDSLREIQARYQQLKKAFDEVTQRFSTLEGHTRELEQAHIAAQSTKTNLEARVESLQKEIAIRTKENKVLRERYNRAMEIASKYSPEMVNSLQGENEKIKSTLAQREREVELLKPECDRLADEISQLKSEITTLTEKQKKEAQIATQARQLARKFRDEKIALEAEKQKLQTELTAKDEEIVKLREISAGASASASTSTGQTPLVAPKPASWGMGAVAANALQGIGAGNVHKKMQEQLSALTKEKEELIAKISELEASRTEKDRIIEEKKRELDEAAEKLIRVDMLEKMLSNNQKKISSLNAEIALLRAENTELQQKILGLEGELAELNEHVCAPPKGPKTPETGEPTTEYTAELEQIYKGDQLQLEQEETLALPTSTTGQISTSDLFSPFPFSPANQPERIVEPTIDEEKLEEEAIFDELCKDECLERIVEIEPGNTVDIDEEDRQPAGETDQPLPQEEHTEQEDLILQGHEVENPTSNEELMLNQGMEEDKGPTTTEEFEAETGGYADEVEDEERFDESDEDEEGGGLMDEDEGDSEFVGEDYDEEELDPEASLEQLEGEPPRKQRRMQDQPPDQEGGPSNQDHDDDDDDDIQFL